MEWLVVLMPILIGIILVLLEILVFPGIGLSGIAGFLSLGGGLYLGYAYFGVPAGHYIVLATAILGGIVTFYALRSSSWRRFGLHATLQESVEGVDGSIQVGDSGISMGRLAPMGNVVVGDSIVEAESLSGYIDSNQPVIVVKVLKNKIVVKAK